jgi:polyhydroxyalkanoate synthesis regulator phasin
MANFDFGDELKKVMLAGIGAAAETTVRASNLVNHLVEKGEITVEQGKSINEELKRNVKEAMDTSTTKVKSEVIPAVDDIVDNLEKMSAEQIQAIKDKLAALDAKNDDSND